MHTLLMVLYIVLQAFENHSGDMSRFIKKNFHTFDLETDQEIDPKKIIMPPPQEKQTYKFFSQRCFKY